MKEKDCTTCGHFDLGCEVKDGVECSFKKTYRSWIPKKGVELKSLAQTAAPEPTAIEKTCVTCKWDHRIDSHGLEKIAFCMPCREHSNWEPREGVAETGKKFAAAPEPTAIEKKHCTTCRHFINNDVCEVEDGIECSRKGTFRSWAPREGVAETGKKFDEGKLRYDLIPVKALREVVKVLTFGAKRYGENNWKITKPESRYTAAAMRHGEAYRDNEIHDPDSGFHHLAHRICCDLFLLQIDLEKEAGK